MGQFSSKLTLETERGNSVVIRYTGSDPEQVQAARDLVAEFERLSHHARQRVRDDDPSLW